MYSVKHDRDTVPRTTEKTHHNQSPQPFSNIPLIPPDGPVAIQIPHDPDLFPEVMAASDVSELEECLVVVVLRVLTGEAHAVHADAVAGVEGGKQHHATSGRTEGSCGLPPGEKNDNYNHEHNGCHLLTENLCIYQFLGNAIIKII